MATHSPVVGRYVTIDVDGYEYKVFYLRNGQGQPLVCQHAAGFHNHQWSDLLEDDEVTRNYDVIAYDLARHGKSDPPKNQEWWKEDYRLTADHFMKFIIRFCDALNLDAPIFLGASFGGNVALQLARHHADRFRGVIPVSASDHSPGFFSDWWRHPQANAGQVIGSVVWDTMAPQSPESDRWLSWHHSTQGAEAFRGDCYFYSVDHDMRDELVNINTKLCPVVLMAGNYDYLAPPKAVENMARKISGSVFIEMENIGHLPMSENYSAFQPYLLEALKIIMRKSRVTSA